MMAVQYVIRARDVINVMGTVTKTALNNWQCPQCTEENGELIMKLLFHMTDEEMRERLKTLTNEELLTWINDLERVSFEARTRLRVINCNHEFELPFDLSNSYQKRCIKCGLWE